MTIYLVRHAQASATWQESDDPGLSKLGHQQAAATAKRLIATVESPVRLVSSPLLRAQETAQPLAQALGANVSIVEAFQEIPAPVPQAQRQVWLTSVAGQSWADQAASVREWRQSLLWHLGQIKQPTVVFTHFMVLNAIVGALSEEEKVMCFYPDNASITRLRWNDEALQVIELGSQRQRLVR